MTQAAAPRAAPPPSAGIMRLGRALLDGLDPITDRLVDAILSADPSYTSRGRLTPEDLTRSCRDNVRRILEALADVRDPAVDPYDAPHATGHRRAEQGIPLESVLHAYRLGHRTIWDALVTEARALGDGTLDVLVAAASEVWELVDTYSSEVARAYRDTELEIARHDDRRRDAIVDALLKGRGTERAVAADAAAALDLPEHARYAVVVLGGVEVGRRVVGALHARNLRTAWRIRADREIGLVALRDAEPAGLVAVLRGVGGLRAGVSPAVDGLAKVDVAHRLAETALRALPPGEPAVAELDARLPGALLVTAPDLAARLVQRALGGVLVLDSDEREVLLDTLRTWLDNDGSAGQTASRLYCHRNTVLNRLRRLEGLTGRSLERVDHMVEWSLALLALDVLPAEAVRQVEQ